MTFLCQLIVGLLANLISALLLYWLLEKRIKDFAEHQRLIGTVKGIKADLNYIEILSENILDAKKMYLEEGKTPHADFPSDALAKFIAESTTLLVQEDIDSLVNFREMLSLTNNFLYKLRATQNSIKDKEKVVLQLIPEIKRLVADARRIVDKLNII